MPRFARLAALTILAAGPFGATSFAANPCDRTCVMDRVDAYVQAMLAHRPEDAGLAAGVRSTENGTVVEVGSGVWETITARGGYHQVVVDSGLDRAVYFGAFSEGDAPVLMAIRLRFAPRGIIELEHLVSRPDRRNRLILLSKLEAPDPVFDQVVPPGERRSRADLVAAANAYFDGIAHSSDDGVPMHPDCRRRENGVLLLHNPKPDTQPCPIGFHRFNYITAVRDRRVAAVDEARGLVLMFAYFDVPGNIEVAPRSRGPSDAGDDGEPRPDTRKIPRSLYIAELFHVVDGGIRDIAAVMYNQDPGATSGW